MHANSASAARKILTVQFPAIHPSFARIAATINAPAARKPYYERCYFSSQRLELRGYLEKYNLRVTRCILRTYTHVR